MLLPVRRESLRVQPSQPGATYTQQLDQHVLRVEVSRSWANRIEITAWGGSLEERRVSRFCIWS